MGWVLMSDRDVRRIEVLTEVLSGRRTVVSAAVVLAITARQVNRLLIRFREDGGGGLIHKGRGQSSNHSMSSGVREYVLELVKSRYADFGPTLATEVLLAKHDIQMGRETLRTWMLEEGLWQSRKQRRSFHQPRLRREGYGELIQIDGSDHRWFEQRGESELLRSHVEARRSVQTIPIEDAKGGHPQDCGLLDHRLGHRGSFQERESRSAMKFHVSVSHTDLQRTRFPAPFHAEVVALAATLR